MKIDEIYNQYIVVKEPLLTKQTINSYISAYDTHILPIFGRRNINAINFIDYQNFANKLLGSGKKPKTVRNILMLLVGIYKFAIKNDWYSGKIYPQMVELPKYDNRFYVTISPDLQKRYLQAIYNFDEDIYRDMFLFLLHGRRLGEVRFLEWQYIDLQQGIVYYPPHKNKSRKHRSYKLTDTLIDILKIYYAREMDMQGGIFVSGYVFKNPKTNQPFSGLAKPWNRLLNNAGLKHFKLHSIRHILGTYLVNTLGFRIQDVSFMLGHSDISITQRYYTPSPDIARDCTQAVLDSFKTKKDKSLEAVNNFIGLGEHIQAVLFSDKETEKMTK